MKKTMPMTDFCFRAISRVLNMVNESTRVEGDAYVSRFIPIDDYCAIEVTELGRPVTHWAIALVSSATGTPDTQVDCCWAGQFEIEDINETLQRRGEAPRRLACSR